MKITITVEMESKTVIFPFEDFRRRMLVGMDELEAMIAGTYLNTLERSLLDHAQQQLIEAEQGK